jgi:hypothetical protein
MSTRSQIKASLTMKNLIITALFLLALPALAGDLPNDSWSWGETTVEERIVNRADEKSQGRASPKNRSDFRVITTRKKALNPAGRHVPEHDLIEEEWWPVKR